MKTLARRDAEAFMLPDRPTPSRQLIESAERNPVHISPPQRAESQTSGGFRGPEAKGATFQ